MSNYLNKKHSSQLKIFRKGPDKYKTLTKRNFMNLLDLAVLALGSSIVLMIFVMRTDLENKSRVRVHAKSKPKKVLTK